LSKPVREKALENIARLREPAAIDPLLAFIGQEPYWDLRSKAMKILGDLAKTDGAQKNKKDAEIASAILRFLGRETDVRMIRVEVEVLGDIGRIEGLNLVHPIIPFLGYGDPEVRAGAASSLGKIDGPEAAAAVEPLCRLLENDEETANTKRHAANALGLIRDARAVPTLVNALSDPDPNIRWSSANSLRSIGDESASGALVKRLAIEKEDRVLDVIVKALDALKCAEAAKPLAFLVRRKPGLAAGALDAIVNIGQKDLDAFKEAATILKDVGNPALVLELLRRFTATPAGKDASVRMDFGRCLEERGSWEEAAAVYARLAAERPEIAAADKGLLRSLDLITDAKAKGKATAGVMSLLPGRAKDLWAGPVRQVAQGPTGRESDLAAGLIEGWSGAKPNDAFFRGLVAYVTHADNSTASAAHRLLRAWTGRKVALLPGNANQSLKEQARKAWQTWYATNKNAFPFLKK
jgi:HEAT repeat protein